VSAGSWHSCGVATNNRAYCWGWNYDGAIGDGTQDRSQDSGSRGGRAQLSAGERRHRPLLPGDHREPGLLLGSNVEGELGNGTTADRLTPVAVASRLSFKQVSTSWLHTCGATDSGTAYCWGLNYDGQLGDGTTRDRSRPTAVSGET
jgi:alpha-tubulin suppressor-like RCC1 family protein